MICPSTALLGEEICLFVLLVGLPGRLTIDQIIERLRGVGTEQIALGEHGISLLFLADGHDDLAIGLIDINAATLQAGHDFGGAAIGGGGDRHGLRLAGDHDRNTAKEQAEHQRGADRPLLAHRQPFKLRLDLCPIALEKFQRSASMPGRKFHVSS